MKTLKKRIGILLLALLFSALAMVRHHRSIYQEMQQQTFDNLRDVALQSQSAIEKELNDTMELLDSIAEDLQQNYTTLSAQKDINSIIYELGHFIDIYRFKRMGVITPDGTGFTTDGYAWDLSQSEYYTYGIQGLSNITEALVDQLGTHEPIHVFSRPLYKDNQEIMGILFAAYPADIFTTPLSVDSFEGHGYSYIINQTGNIINNSAQSPMQGAQNILDTLLTYDTNNSEVVDRLKEAMQSGESSHETFASNDTKYLYYMPLEVDALRHNWYLYTIVPAEILEEKVESILQHQNNFLLIILVIIVLLFLYFIWDYSRDARTLQELAYKDPLTQGDNYASFLKRMQQANGNGYMVSLDLNEFKLLNSICGFSTGDLILKAIWEILVSHLEKEEFAAHVAADRYVMFLHSDTRTGLLERIHHISDEISSLTETYNTIQISSYYGIYETADTTNPEEGYTRSLQAKKLAKDNPQKNWAFYEEVDLASITENKQLVDHFEEAIKNHEFEVWYQPKYDTDNGTIVGAEALVRWRKPDGTLIPPFRFIPLFERNGMIVTLDEYVFTTVCKQIKSWNAQHKKHLPISINISRASLYYDFIVERYTKILAEHGIKPSLVPLEVTESATINNQQIQELMNRFRQVGFPMYLDDFGNGYSSLSTLNMMHFDTIKLDKSLVDYIGDTNGEKLLRYTIKLAKSLGMRITAEGVETERQVQFLKTLHCDEIQGYYFSKPLPLEEFEKLI